MADNRGVTKLVGSLALSEVHILVHKYVRMCSWVAHPHQAFTVKAFTESRFVNSMWLRFGRAESE